MLSQKKQEEIAKAIIERYNEGNEVQAVNLLRMSKFTLPEATYAWLESKIITRDPKADPPSSEKAGSSGGEN